MKIVYYTPSKELTQEQIEKVNAKIIEDHGTLDDVKAVTVTPVEGSKVKIEYEVAGEEEPKFERIRRVTGYLTGSVDTWNNAKKAELSERVKHA